MRVNPNIYPAMVDLLTTATSNEQTTLEQMSTGRRVNRPSDDPIAEATMVSLQSQAQIIKQEQSNVGTLQQQLNTADSAMSSIVTVVQKAMTLGTQGATTSLSDANRQALANEVSGIKQQVVNLANSTYNGVFLFGGSSTATPFVNSAAGADYKGNSTPNQVEVGRSQTMDSGIDGSKLFGVGGANDLFVALQNLDTALNGSDITAISQATTSLNQAYSAFNSQRTSVSNEMTQLSSIATVLTNQSTQIASAQNDAVGADLATVASTFTQQETARTALMKAIGKVSQDSLINYLSS